LVDDIPDQRLMLLLALAAVLVASSVHLLFDDRLNLDENHSAFTDRSGVNSMASSYSIDQIKIHSPPALRAVLAILSFQGQRPCAKLRSTPK
jgi:hypothetical protein